MDIHCADVSIVRLTVGHDLTIDLRENFTHYRIINAEHSQPVERQVVQKFDEGALQLVEVALIGRHVVSIDIRNNGNHRLQVQE